MNETKTTNSRGGRFTTTWIHNFLGISSFSQHIVAFAFSRAATSHIVNANQFPFPSARGMNLTANDKNSTVSPRRSARNSIEPRTGAAPAALTLARHVKQFASFLRPPELSCTTKHQLWLWLSRLVPLSTSRTTFIRRDPMMQDLCTRWKR